MIAKAFASVVPFTAFLFPWPLTAALALGAAFFEPLVLLATGILLDVLYYPSHSGAVPFFTIAGACATGAAFFVRSRLKTRSIDA